LTKCARGECSLRESKTATESTEVQFEHEQMHSMDVVRGRAQQSGRRWQPAAASSSPVESCDMSTAVVCVVWLVRLWMRWIDLTAVGEWCGSADSGSSSGSSERRRVSGCG